MNLANLFKTIKHTVLGVEEDLRAIDEGMFFAPELYTAFSIGRDIKKAEGAIFGRSVKWLRETKFSSGGSTDIAFCDKDLQHTYIEVKLRDTYDAYLADLNKLRLLNGNSRFFCVMIDSFKLENDDRLTELERKNLDLVRIGHHAFETKQHWYKKQVYCNLNLYQIL